MDHPGNAFTEDGEPAPADGRLDEVSQRVVGLDSATQAILGSGYQINIGWSERQVGGLEPPVHDALERPYGGRAPAQRAQVWNVDARNPGFVGRELLLVDLRRRLHSGGTAVVQALRGMGGIGKTQLAMEYAYRHAGDYDAVWWIAAEQEEFIAEQLAALGAELQVVPPQADTLSAARIVRSHLRSRDGWLLIFDNAVSPDKIRPWLPGGQGHVIVTSRHRRWTDVAAVVEVNVMSRQESAALLTSHHAGLCGSDAERIADALGDLPLALAQAAAFLAETGTSVDEYLELLGPHATELLDSCRPVTYPHSLAAAIIIATSRLSGVDPAALGILQLCAILAPEPVPVDLLTVQVPEPDRRPLPPTLAALVATYDKPVALRRSIGRIVDYGLAGIGDVGLTLHRLTQAVLRDHLDSASAIAVRGYVEALLVAGDPGHPRDPVYWPTWSRLLPHILAVDPATSDMVSYRHLGVAALWYLSDRGGLQGQLTLSQHFYERWRERLSPSDECTLAAANHVARAQWSLGQYRLARDLSEDALARCRNALGGNHQLTMEAVNTLGLSLRYLGEPQLALPFDQDNLERKQRLYGDDHRTTMGSASNVAEDLLALGQIESAYSVAEETYLRRCRVSGPDHPHTLIVASVLAKIHRQMGNVDEARRLDADTLARRREVLGSDHPHTLMSASVLADTLRELGKVSEARRLDEDTLARRRRVLGEDHPDTVATASALAAQRSNPRKRSKTPRSTCC